MLSSGVDGDSHKWIDAENGGKIDELIRKTMSRISHCSPFYQGKMKFFATSESSRKAAGNKNRVFMMCHSCQSCKKTASFSEAMCSELPQQSYHQYNQSSIPSCDDRVFSDERPSVKMKLDDIWNNKLQAQGECTSTRDGESKERKPFLQFNFDRQKLKVSYILGQNGGTSVQRLQLSTLAISRMILQLLLYLVKMMNFYPFQYEMQSRTGTENLKKWTFTLSRCQSSPMVDKKFIPTLQMSGILLEELREKVVPEIGYQLLHNCADQIQNWGWMYNIHSQASRSFTWLREVRLITTKRKITKRCVCVVLMCNRLARNDVQHLTPSVGTIDTEFDWRSILLFIEDTVMNLWTGSNSVGCSPSPASLRGGGALWKVSGRESPYPSEATKHFSYPPHLLLSHSLLRFSDILVNYEIKKKKCRAQSCKVTLELPSPQPKKLIGECTVRRERFDLHRIFCWKVLLKSLIPSPDSSVRPKFQVETRAVRRLQHSSKAICSELPQQSSHKCDQSSTQSCGDSVFSDERPSVKMKLVNMWNSKLHTQGVCTSTHYGESKEERYWNSLKNQNNILNVTSGILHFVGASLVPDIIDKTAWWRVPKFFNTIGAPSFSLLTMVSYASFTPTTSKYSHSNDMHAFPASFGFKREALSSISDISLLDIVLKLTGGQMDINGKCLYLGVDDCRQNVGTTVIVRDVFYNQPVRRKQMHSNPKKVLHSLKESLLLYILSFKLLRLKVRMTCVAHMLLFLHVYYCPVSVAIGVGTCYVKVDDIGSGVTRWTGADGRKMCKLQGQGECTSTRDGESKEDDMHAFPASFGLKGETLSSISDVSLLELLPKLTGGQMDIDKVFFCREEALVSFELMKDKWRNMSVMTNGCGSREKASDEEMAEARLATTSSDSPQIRGSKRSIIRLENLIMEAISNLKEPGGSNKTTIATYIEFSREADAAQAFAEAAMKAL
ncbi:hypothetical protein KY289_003477 [Solanum tuberosum]|nr:hypothetical protein KY289_003477 [Solanum tuberosum]